MAYAIYTDVQFIESIHCIVADNDILRLFWITQRDAKTISTSISSPISISAVGKIQQIITLDFAIP